MNKNNEISGEDLTLWHCHYFLRWQGRDTSPTVEENWKIFARVLDKAVDWADARESSLIAKPFSYNKNRLISARLALIDFDKTVDFPRTLESRSLLDTYYIQVASAKRNESSVNDLEPLKEQDWRPDYKISSYLGDGVCLWIEHFPKISEKNAQHIALSLLERWFEKKQERLEVIEFNFGFLIFPENATENICVLIVTGSIKNKEFAQQKASYVVSWILPQIWHTKLKCVLLQKRFDAELPKIRALEAKLHLQINKSLKNPRYIEILEQNIDELSQTLVEFTGLLGICDDYFETLRINANNLERILADPFLTGQTQQLTQILLLPLRNLIWQMEADLRYAQIENTRAEKVLQSFNAMSQVQQAKWERHTAFLFGVFVLFGAVDVFKEIPEWSLRNRVLYLLISGLILFLLTHRQSLIGRIKAWKRKDSSAETNDSS